MPIVRGVVTMHRLRLDLSLGQFVHMPTPRRRLALLTCLLILLTVILHLEYFPIRTRYDFYPVSYVCELLIWITLLGMFWSVQCAFLPRTAWRLLSAGLILWMLATTVDVMDELVEQPEWVALWLNIVPRAIGILIAAGGILATVTYVNHIHAQLRMQAMSDELTALPNRRHFRQQLAHYHNEPLSLLLIDLDHFKQVNDRYGHDVGDDVLIEFGQLLNRLCPPDALAARLGGEEFALLLPTEQSAELDQLAARILHECHTIRISAQQHLTVSIGAGTRHSGETVERLMKRVDEALYQAKEAGRNQLMWAAEPIRHSNSHTG